MNGDLFSLVEGELVKQPRLRAGGWYALPTRLGGRAGAWRNVHAPGLEVRHCGHPTANRPYHLIGVPVTRKFYNLAEAQRIALLAHADPDRYEADPDFNIKACP
jgi:hypothetical protein